MCLSFFVLKVAEMLTNNTKGQITGNITYQGSVGFSRRRLLATSTQPNSPLTGVINPTVCLAYGSLMMFAVTNEHYPVYDRYVFVTLVRSVHTERLYLRL